MEAGIEKDVNGASVAGVTEARVGDPVPMTAIRA